MPVTALFNLFFLPLWHYKWFLSCFCHLSLTLYILRCLILKFRSGPYRLIKCKKKLCIWYFLLLFKVYFINEEAEDAGGVKKEFFLLLLREVLDPKYGMFTSDTESNFIWFSEMSFEDEIMYYLVGKYFLVLILH